MLKKVAALCFYIYCSSALAAATDSCSWMLKTYIAKFDSVGLASRLDVPRVNKYLRGLRKYEGVTVQEIARPFGNPVYKVKIKSTAKQGNLPMRVLMTVGIHGNEPIGVTAGLQTIESFLSSKRLRENFELTFIMMNPPALKKGSRRIPKIRKSKRAQATASELESAGLDLNRQFKDKWPPEFDGIRRAIENEVFDIGLDYHGGPTRQDFFMIKGRKDGNFSKSVLQAINDQPLLPSTSGRYPGYQGVRSNPRIYRMLSHGETISFTKGTMKTWMIDRPMWWSATLEYPGRMDAVEAHAGLYRMGLSILWHARQQAPELYRGLSRD